MGGLAGNHDGSFPKRLGDCFYRVHHWFSGWHENLFDDCVMSAFGISAPCTACFVEAGQYSYRECANQCILSPGSWCSEQCLECTARHDTELKLCVGVNVKVPKPDIC